MISVNAWGLAPRGHGPWGRADGLGEAREDLGVYAIGLLASRPLARAKSRAWLGFTTATGSSPARGGQRAAPTGPSKPPWWPPEDHQGTGRSSRRQASQRSVFRAGGVVLGTPKVWPRLPPLPARAARRPPLSAPWRPPPPPPKPPCAHWDHRGHLLLGLVARPCGDAGSLPLFASREAPGNSVRALFAKRGARRPYSYVLRSFRTRAGAALSRPLGRFYDR